MGREVEKLVFGAEQRDGPPFALGRTEPGPQRRIVEDVAAEAREEPEVDLHQRPWADEGEVVVLFEDVSQRVIVLLGELQASHRRAGPRDFVGGHQHVHVGRGPGQGLLRVQAARQSVALEQQGADAFRRQRVDDGQGQALDLHAPRELGPRIRLQLSPVRRGQRRGDTLGDHGFGHHPREPVARGVGHHHGGVHRGETFPQPRWLCWNRRQHFE